MNRNIERSWRSRWPAGRSARAFTPAWHSHTGGCRASREAEWKPNSTFHQCFSSLLVGGGQGSYHIRKHRPSSLSLFPEQSCSSPSSTSVPSSGLAQAGQHSSFCCEIMCVQLQLSQHSQSFYLSCNWKLTHSIFIWEVHFEFCKTDSCTFQLPYLI